MNSRGCPIGRTSTSPARGGAEQPGAEAGHGVDWNAAVDRPLIGVGFNAANDVVFARYAPLDGGYAVFRGRVWVAHSIYFQMLGEHGFVGLALFLLLGALSWIKAGQLARTTVGDPELSRWVPSLMRMVQVSLIGFAVGGAFLSLANHDLPYYFVGFVIATDGIVRRRLTASATKSAPPESSGPRAEAGARAGSLRPR